MQINWHGVGVYLAMAPVDMRKAIDGLSMMVASLLSHIAVAKYDDHQPHGIDIARNTLGDWMIRTGDAITPLITFMRDDILSYDVAFADETPVQVLTRPGKSAKAKSYM